MAQPTHRHDLAHRGLVPVSQLASGTPSTGYVPAYAGTLNAVWTALGSLGAMTNPMTTQDDVIVGGAVTGGVAAPARLGKGSDGQVLTVDPTTHHLIWVTPATVPAVGASGDMTAEAIGSTVSAGASGKYSDAGHRHAMPAAGAAGDIGVETSGVAAAAGATGKIADAGHVHSMPTIPAAPPAAASTVTGPDAFGASAVVGTGTTYARADHDHGLPANPVRAQSSTTPAAVGTAAVGTGTTDARADHVHATGAGTPSTQAFGDAAATGTGPAAAMTDHKHAMPCISRTIIVSYLGTIAPSTTVSMHLGDTTSTNLPRLPLAGHVVGISAYCNSRAAGTATFTVYNGTDAAHRPYSAPQAIIDATASHAYTYTAPSATNAFAAGDLMQIQITTDGSWSGGGTWNAVIDFTMD